MICAYINGKIAYPVAESDIKITLQNPFIKDGDEKSMEVVFPLDIPENREVFGPLNRLDTSFENIDYDNCRLMADNFVVVSGKGTVTSVTNTEVKIQILAGKSYLRYKASFDHIFIDELDYGQVANKYKLFGTAKTIQDVSRLSVTGDLNSKGFIGVAGQYVFMPVHDEGDDIWANAPAYIYEMGSEGSLLCTTIVRAAVQPNLMMVLGKVIERLGYTMIRNDFNISPWNKLYVASARVSLSMAKALPHWSCYKFLDEIRKLFNAVFIFDEAKRTVSLVPFNSARDSESVEIDPVEDFSTSYDEEGLEYLEASNLQYELSDCERTPDVVSEDLRNMFEVREYDSASAMQTAFRSLSQQEKLTSLFHCPTGWFYGSSVINDDGEVLGIYLNGCGWHSPLIRKAGAAAVSLNIVPVAMAKSECRICCCIQAHPWLSSKFIGNYPNMIYSFEGPVANVNCDSQTEAEYLGSSALKEVEYVTVEDVLINNESGPSEESDNSTLEVFFVDGQKYRYRGELEFVEKVEFETDMPDPPSEIILPVPFTDSRMEIFPSLQMPAYSMSILPSSDVACIGQYHNQGLQIKRNVNGNNEICIKFLYDGKPDPRKIYLCRGKRFIASHIDMAVNARGIDPLKTGYFYEILL